MWFSAVPPSPARWLFYSLPVFRFPLRPSREIQVCLCRNHGLMIISGSENKRLLGQFLSVYSCRQLYNVLRKRLFKYAMCPILTIRLRRFDSYAFTSMGTALRNNLIPLSNKSQLNWKITLPSPFTSSWVIFLLFHNLHLDFALRFGMSKKKICKMNNTTCLYLLYSDSLIILCLEDEFPLPAVLVGGRTLETAVVFLVITEPTRGIQPENWRHF